MRLNVNKIVICLLLKNPSAIVTIITKTNDKKNLHYPSGNNQQKFQINRFVLSTTVPLTYFFTHVPSFIHKITLMKPSFSDSYYCLLYSNGSLEPM